MGAGEGGAMWALHTHMQHGRELGEFERLRACLPRFRPFSRSLSFIDMDISINPCLGCLIRRSY